MKKKVVFTINKEGQVFLRAEGYQNQECLKSQNVQNLLSFLKREGEIDVMEVQRREKEGFNSTR